MELRNLAWHRAEIARIVNFKDGTPDQDFVGPTNAPWLKVDAAFNEAQTFERNLAIQEGGSSWALNTIQKTWLADAVTFVLPNYIDRESIHSIHDVTSDVVGIPVTPGPRSANRKIFFLDAHTLQWGTTGPGSNTTLEISYLAEAVALTDPNQEAALFPYNHRHLLNWSASTILVDMADQRVPDTWTKRVENYRSIFQLALTRGVPSETNVPRIRNHRARR